MGRKGHVVCLQAFYLARTGRPGPVLIDVPKDVQQQLAVPDWDVRMAISGYMKRLPNAPTEANIRPIMGALKKVIAPLPRRPFNIQRLVVGCAFPTAIAYQGLPIYPSLRFNRTSKCFSLVWNDFSAEDMRSAWSSTFDGSDM